MKRTSRCPKCGSHDVIADAKAIDRSENYVQADMSVATFRNPHAFLFKGQQTTSVSAWVCGSCGFVELYADAPKDIRV